MARQNYNSKRYMYPYAHSSTIHSSQDTETTYMPINRSKDKEGVCVCICVCVYIYIAHTEYMVMLLSHKKEQNRAICSNTEGPRN